MSDTAFTAGATFDRSGPALVAALPSSLYTVVATAIVPDERKEIHDQVKRWCEDGVGLILTTGGTGFGARDVTPDAVAPLITKPAPGLVVTMISHSLKITPTAALSRPVAGVCVLPANLATGRGTIIVTLPGSPKGQHAVLRLETLFIISNRRNRELGIARSSSAARPRAGYRRNRSYATLDDARRRTSTANECSSAFSRSRRLLSRTLCSDSSNCRIARSVI